jgi:hypothetical protein
VLIHSVAHRLPVWKDNLLHRSSRLTLIKTTLAVVPAHTTISLELPPLVCKALVKIMRGFLWPGTDTIQGGKCVVAWNQVSRPLSVSGYGIPDLKLMGISLWLRWLWFQRYDRLRSWVGLPFKVDAMTNAFFKASIRCIVRDGSATLFWTDPWLDGHCISHCALDLVATVAAYHQCQLIDLSTL